MVKTRIILVVVCALLVWLIFLLPKSVVENESQLQGEAPAETPGSHAPIPETVRAGIRQLRSQFVANTSNQKNAIFADSLRALYTQAGQFDSAAWFADHAASFFNTTEGYLKAGNSYYEAYTFAMEPAKQEQLAGKTREWLGKVLAAEPGNLEAKTKVAMTYLSSASPMQGITLLREVLAEDPKNEFALYNMGMLSVQSGQYDRAIERLEELKAVNPNHIQGSLLLGIAYLNKANKEKAREQFEWVKKLDQDPAVQATVDSYLQELK